MSSWAWGPPKAEVSMARVWALPTLRKVLHLSRRVFLSDSHAYDASTPLHTGAGGRAL